MIKALEGGTRAAIQYWRSLSSDARIVAGILS